MYGLEGRKAIVTGAAHGIGRAIATRLASEGCQVGILDQDAAATGATAAARLNRKLPRAMRQVSSSTWRTTFAPSSA
jgi:NAD(P)-dependent dehydrogenase (short-subunit alcohol dehydrogenase family)